MRARAVASVVAVALVVAACGTGQEEVAGDGGLGSDIGVHGAWTIDVHGADGGVVRSAEFENALMLNGQHLLDNLLSRESSMGAWAVVLTSSGTTQPCTDGAASQACRIVEPGWVVPGDDQMIFENLTLDATDATDTSIALSGSAVVANDTAIGVVGSHYKSCAPDVAPEVCGSAAGENLLSSVFTQVGVSTLDWDDDGNANDGPIPVTAGQTIQVTVEISFGTLP